MHVGGSTDEWMIPNKLQSDELVFETQHMWLLGSHTTYQNREIAVAMSAQVIGTSVVMLLCPVS